MLSLKVNPIHSWAEYLYKFQFIFKITFLKWNIYICNRQNTCWNISNSINYLAGNIIYIVCTWAVARSTECINLPQTLRTFHEPIFLWGNESDRFFYAVTPQRSNCSFLNFFSSLSVLFILIVYTCITQSSSCPSHDTLTQVRHSSIHSERLYKPVISKCVKLWRYRMRKEYISRSIHGEVFSLSYRGTLLAFDAVTCFVLQRPSILSHEYSECSL